MNVMKERYQVLAERIKAGWAGSLLMGQPQKASQEDVPPRSTADEWEGGEGRRGRTACAKSLRSLSASAWGRSQHGRGWVSKEGVTRERMRLCICPVEGVPSSCSDSQDSIHTIHIRRCQRSLTRLDFPPTLEPGPLHFHTFISTRQVTFPPVWTPHSRIKENNRNPPIDTLFVFLCRAPGIVLCCILQPTRAEVSGITHY